MKSINLEIVEKYLLKNKGRFYIQKVTVNKCLRLILRVLK